MARVYLSPPDVGPLEREFLLRAFDSGWVAPVGPDLDAFEQEIADLTGWPGAVALSSGTAALHLALLVSGVRPGDDVLVATFTFVASANAVVYCGANPIFIDSETSTWNMSPQLLADALAAARRRNKLPKAVVVVDLYGQCADYDEIVPLCGELGITVIEDAAEAVGATHKGGPAGTLGDIGVFSFNGNKIITTSSGGALLTPDPAIADRVRYLAGQARQPAAHYEHTEVGYNYRLSNLLAAVGRAQLVRLPEIVERRLAVDATYREQLSGMPGITFMPIAPWGGWNGWLTCVVFDDTAQRDDAQARLAANDVESRPLWKPMHCQPCFADRLAVVDGTSERLFRNGLALPSGGVVDAMGLAALVSPATRRGPTVSA
jgi:dTDP-4-amino-4,6-dideoxygalactose transaminase